MLNLIRKVKKLIRLVGFVIIDKSYSYKITYAFSLSPGVFSTTSKWNEQVQVVLPIITIFIFIFWINFNIYYLYNYLILI